MKYKEHIPVILLLVISIFSFSQWLSSSNPLFSDASLHVYTLNHFRKAILSGNLPIWDKFMGLGYPYLIFYQGVLFYIIFGFLAVFSSSSFAYNFGFFLSGIISIFSSYFLLKYLKISDGPAVLCSFLYAVNYHVFMWFGVFMGNPSWFFASSFLPLAVLLFLKIKNPKNLYYSIVLSIIGYSHLIVFLMSLILFSFLLLFELKKTKKEILSKFLFIVFGVLLSSAWYVPSLILLEQSIGIEKVSFSYGSQSLTIEEYFFQMGAVLIFLSLISLIFISFNLKKSMEFLPYSLLFFLTFLFILGFFKEILAFLPFFNVVQFAWRWSAINLLCASVLSGFLISEIWKKIKTKFKIKFEKRIFLGIVVLFILLNNSWMKLPSAFMSQAPKAWIDSKEFLDKDTNFYRILTLPETCGIFNMVQEKNYFSACNIETHNLPLDTREFKKEIQKIELIQTQNYTNILKLFGVKYIEILAEFFIPYHDYGKLEQNYNTLNNLLSNLSKRTDLSFAESFESDMPNIGFITQWGINQNQLIIFNTTKEPLRYFFVKELKNISSSCSQEIIDFLLKNEPYKEMNFWFRNEGSSCDIEGNLEEESILNSVSFKENFQSFEITADLKTPAYVIINENNILGWTAKINNKNSEIQKVFPDFIVLKLNSGINEIKIYQSLTVYHYLGILLSFISLLSLFLFWLKF